MSEFRKHTGPEKKLQEACETWLRLYGFWSRTQENIMRGTPPKGWYLHLFKAKHNPIILDLLLLFNNGTYWECELKIDGGEFSPHQRKLITEGADFAFSLEELEYKLKRWMIRTTARRGDKF